MPKRQTHRKYRLAAGIAGAILIFLIAAILVFKVPVFQKLRYYLDKIEFYFAGHDDENQSIRKNFTLYGIDISHHNGLIDWKKLKSKGRINGKALTFVIMKATEGKSHKDRRYKYNRRQAKKHGFICGSYHFYRPEVNSLLQFKNFKETVILESGDFPPVLDVEKRGNLSYSRYTQGILNLLELMENHYGAKPVIYTSPALYSTLRRNKKFLRYPVWLATYTTNIPEKFKDKVFLIQYSEKGHVAGIKHYVDLNGFIGNKFDLQKYLIK